MYSSGGVNDNATSFDNATLQFVSDEVRCFSQNNGRTDVVVFTEAKGASQMDCTTECAA
jgi:hypothetical protein